MTGLRLLCAYYLKNITALNGQALNSQEIESSSNKKFTIDTVIAHSLYIVNRPRTLRYCFVTDYCKADKNIQGQYFYDDQVLLSTSLNVHDPNWQYKVCLKGWRLVFQNTSTYQKLNLKRKISRNVIYLLKKNR